MVRNGPSGPDNLKSRLSSFADYLKAVAELRTKLLHSSPSYLISDPEEVCSKAIVARHRLT